MFTHRTLARMCWLAPEQRLEFFLFAAVQTIIFGGTVLVAAQILLTAAA